MASSTTNYKPENAPNYNQPKPLKGCPRLSLVERGGGGHCGYYVFILLWQDILAYEQGNRRQLPTHMIREIRDARANQKLLPMPKTNLRGIHKIVFHLRQLVADIIAKEGQTAALSWDEIATRSMKTPFDSDSSDHGIDAAFLEGAELLLLATTFEVGLVVYTTTNHKGNPDITCLNLSNPSAVRGIGLMANVDNQSHFQLMQAQRFTDDPVYEHIYVEPNEKAQLSKLCQYKQKRTSRQWLTFVNKIFRDMDNVVDP
jgi:hypothetical protein